MRDADCVQFLQWALPRMGLRWPGFRRVRRQVCRRIARRIAELGLEGPAAYGAHLEDSPAEWAVLDRLCHATVSRFWRERALFAYLAGEALPALAARAAQGRVDIWSAGCASGEEPYSVVLAWALGAGLEIGGVAVLATDREPRLIERARRACYPPGSLRDLPDGWRDTAFRARNGQWCLQRPFRDPVRFLLHDVRDAPPEGRFPLILCRNLAFTYLDAAAQRRVLGHIERALEPGGLLVLGAHEALPPGSGDWLVARSALPVFRRAAEAEPAAGAPGGP